MANAVLQKKRLACRENVPNVVVVEQAEHGAVGVHVPRQGGCGVGRPLLDVVKVEGWRPAPHAQQAEEQGLHPEPLPVDEFESDVVDAVGHQVGDEDHQEVGGDAGLGDGPVDQERQVDQVDEDDQDQAVRRVVLACPPRLAESSQQLEYLHHTPAGPTGFVFWTPQYF